MDPPRRAARRAPTAGPTGPNSFVLVLLYPLEARKESHVKIEAVRELYKDHFQQQSVLRVDDPRAVRVGF
jgi:Protein of unknown function (DUF3574)